MDAVRVILYILLAPVIGGLLDGLDRRISARMQGRQGPPILQPFYDLGKFFCRKSGRCKYICIRILPSTDHIPKEHSGHHGGTHPPFLKTCCHIPVRPFFRISSDKRNPVCCYTILGRPAGCHLTLGIYFFCRFF